MEIYFDPSFFDEEPEDFYDHCVKQWGKNSAKKMERRLQQARAAKNLSVLVPYRAPGSWHFLKGDRKQQISVDLEHPLRALFKVLDGCEQFMLENGSIDTPSIESIIIFEVADTHK